MFERSVADLTPEEILTRVGHMTWMRNLLDAEELAAAACWADAHCVLEHSPSLPGTEQLLPFGGDGTSEVAEFAPAELGAVTGVSFNVAAALIGDALDLRHRYPQLWGRVQAGEIKVWAARRIVQVTRHLSRDAAGLVDRVIAPYADRKAAGELVAFAEAEAIRVDPELARSRAEAAQRDRGVWTSPDVQDGIGSMFIRADAADIHRFDHTLDTTADHLALLGDESSKDERRAKAVEILASPQLALDLHTQATGQAPIKSTGSGFPQATLYIHLTDHTLASGEGVARVEGIGPIPAEQVKEWLRHDRVTVKPVIDLNNQAPFDGYEIPDRLREAVHLAMPCDSFPYATSKTRRKDIDHTDPYHDTGPPGQTAIGNLAPLTRRSHRIKTHTRWQVRQPFPGLFVWRSPHGHHYLVDHTGTRRLQAA